MKINIPPGSEISRTEENTLIKIRVPHTKYWMLGEKVGKTWNIYLIDPETNYKERIKQNYTTKAFSIFSSVILKTPFPYTGKRAHDPKIIKRFLKKINK